MKKSEVVSEIYKILKTWENSQITEELAEEVLAEVESLGMRPITKASLIRGKDWKWGGGCSMRCNCDECDPNYKMRVWEKE